MPFAILVGAVVVGNFAYNVIDNVIASGLNKAVIITKGWAQRMKERDAAKSGTIVQ